MSRGTHGDASDEVSGGSSEGRQEAEAEMESSRRRDERNGGRGGRYRSEVEIDRGIAIPRGPEHGFAAAVREPLVKLQRPKYDFERWDWTYYDWPDDRLDANFEMRDSDPTATMESDRKAQEEFLSQKQLELENYEMEIMLQELQRQVQQQEGENSMQGPDLAPPAAEPVEANDSGSPAMQHTTNAQVLDLPPPVAEPVEANDPGSPATQHTTNAQILDLPPPVAEPVEANDPGSPATQHTTNAQGPDLSPPVAEPAEANDPGSPATQHANDVQGQ